MMRKRQFRKYQFWWWNVSIRFQSTIYKILKSGIKVSIKNKSHKNVLIFYSYKNAQTFELFIVTKILDKGL